MDIFPQKILLINGLQVGDVVLTTPIIKALKEKFPNSVITCMVRPENEAIVKNLPFLDDYVLYQKEDGWRGFYNTCKKIWQYDIALCIDFKYRSAVLPFFARIPIRAGLRHKRGLLLTHPVDLDPNEESIYQPYNYASLIERSSGIKLAGDLSELHVPPVDEAQKNKVDSYFNLLNLKPGELVISIAPFTSTPRKEWPIDRYSHLVALLKQKYDCQIIMLGGPNDTQKGSIDGALNLAGKTSLLEMSEVIRRSHLFIGCCSAPLHIAAAVKTPAIALYGANSPQQWAPPAATVLFKKLDCNPCIGKPVECDHYSCMKSLSVDEVFAACDAKLQQIRQP